MVAQRQGHGAFRNRFVAAVDADLGCRPGRAGLERCARGDIRVFRSGRGGTVFDLDRTAASVSRLHTFGLGETSGDYARRMNAINPSMHRALAQPGHHTASTRRWRETVPWGVIGFDRSGD